MKTIMDRILKEIILYKMHAGFFLQICAVQDLLKDQYAIIVVNNIYTYEEMQHDNLQKIYFEQLQIELQDPFQDWFPTIEEAIDSFMKDFFYE